jgi:tetratricopeptide (TPR) repeat protein
VSEEALQAASKALELLPGHPMPYLLMGHLLYRSERAGEAVPYFRKAVELAGKAGIEPEQERLKMTALLYESTALWSSYQDEAALATRRAMNAEKLDAGMLATPVMVLRRWEANTLPLRILIRREVAPTVVEIRAASNAATPSPALPGKDAVLVVRDCLRAALYARARVKTADRQNAQKSLALAQQKLNDSRARRMLFLLRGRSS